MQADDDGVAGVGRRREVVDVVAHSAPPECNAPVVEDVEEVQLLVRMRFEV